MNYLSIDLDYFTSLDDFHNIFSKPCFKQECKVVTNHEQLLPDLARVKTKENNLFNLDYHADIVYFGSTLEIQKKNFNNELKETGLKHYLMCSCWVNLVPWQSTSNYYWIHPKDIGVSGNCWSEDTENPFLRKNKPVWKSLHRGTNINIIPWNKIDMIGICVSPEWTLVQYLDLPFIKKQNKNTYQKLLRICTREGKRENFQKSPIKIKEY